MGLHPFRCTTLRIHRGAEKKWWAWSYCRKWVYLWNWLLAHHKWDRRKRGDTIFLQLNAYIKLTKYNLLLCVYQWLRSKEERWHVCLVLIGHLFFVAMPNMSWFITTFLLVHFLKSYPCSLLKSFILISEALWECKCAFCYWFTKDW